jgi:23S rRNA pseudouridine2605 synthase
MPRSSSNKKNGWRDDRKRVRKKTSSSRKKDRTRAQNQQTKQHRGNDQDTDASIRLQKVLAAAGVGSRRQCEQLILEGRVDVDGKTVSELGTRVDPARQKIRVDGENVRTAKRKLYFLVNKPVGILSTSQDPAGRPRVIDLAPSQQRLFTVGRLDKSSSGLILVTNDGELTDLLTHPRYGVEKTYLAQVAGVPTPESLAKLERGVHLAEGYAHAERVTVRHSHRHSTLLEIVLAEGRNREVRRLLARLGHKVLSLRRIAMGPLRLGNLQPGETRPLRNDEVEELYETARAKRKKSKRRPERPKTKNRSGVPGDRAEHEVEKTPRVEAIIDYSLPEDTDENVPLDIDVLAGESYESHDKETEPDGVRIDLSPMGRGGRGSRQSQGTIIGGDRNADNSVRDGKTGRGFGRKKRKKQRRHQ